MHAQNFLMHKPWNCS